MPKTTKEAPMVMAISWMSRINKAEAQDSKDKVQTAQETEVKQDDTKS